MKKAVKVVKAAAKNEAGEFAKLAREQIYPTSKERISPIVEAMQQRSDGSVDTSSLKQSEQQKLSELRQRLAEIQGLDKEQKQIAQKREQIYQQATTSKKQEVHTQEVKAPQGKIRRALGGAKKRISQIANKSETGRGAKN